MSPGGLRLQRMVRGTEKAPAARADAAMDSPNQRSSDAQDAEYDPSAERAPPGGGSAWRGGSVQVPGESIEQRHHRLLDSSVRNEVAGFRLQLRRQRRIRERPVPKNGVLPRLERLDEDSEDYRFLPIESPGLENGLAEAFDVREWILPACEDEDLDSETRFRVFNQDVDTISPVAIENRSVVGDRSDRPRDVRRRC